MIRWFNRIILASAILIAGCSASSNQSTNTANGTSTALSGDSSQQAATSDGLHISANANWTLYCQIIRTPDHISRAKSVKDALIKSTGMKGWYVIHGESSSSLYYGFYDAIEPSANRTDAARAQADRRLIIALRQPNGEIPFRAAVFVPLEQADPPAPSEWDLTNTPPDAFWSVQIAAYADSPQRKQYAVDAVKAARDMGIPAYYYHGQSVSSVCIGTWPRSAVREQQTSQQYNNDPNSSLLVLGHAIAGLPENLRDKEGNPIRTVAPNVEIADPTLTATLRKYPYYSVNGQERVRQFNDPKTGEVKTQRDPTFLVQIPHKTPSLLTAPMQLPQAPANNWATTPNQPAEPAAAPAQPAPQTPTAPQSGRLRSIGD